MKYKVEDVKIGKFEEALNDRAKDGWEYVEIIRAKGFQYEILFRHK